MVVLLRFGRSLSEGLKSRQRASGFIFSERLLMTWESLLSVIPDLKYVIPKDMGIIRTSLERSHSINMVVRDDGLPYQVGRVSLCT